GTVDRGRGLPGAGGVRDGGGARTAGGAPDLGAGGGADGVHPGGDVGVGCRVALRGGGGGGGGRVRLARPGCVALHLRVRGAGGRARGHGHADHDRAGGPAAPVAARLRAGGRRAGRRLDRLAAGAGHDGRGGGRVAVLPAGCDGFHAPRPFASRAVVDPWVGGR